MTHLIKGALPPLRTISSQTLIRFFAPSSALLKPSFISNAHQLPSSNSITASISFPL